MRRSEIQWACGNAEISLSLALPIDSSVASLSTNTPHIYRRPHVTTYRSRSEVSSSSSTFTTLPPCTPSTRRALLFYYSTRPQRVRLVASAYIPGDLSSPPLSLFFPLLLSLISSATAARFSTNGETGISASNTRIFSCCCCCCCSPCSLPLLFCLRHLLLEARLQLVCLGFGASRRRERIPLVSFYYSLYRHGTIDTFSLTRSHVLKSCTESRKNWTFGIQLEFIRFAFD